MRIEIALVIGGRQISLALLLGIMFGIERHPRGPGILRGIANPGGRNRWLERL
jgi:hypothetical protein